MLEVIEECAFDATLMVVDFESASALTHIGSWSFMNSTGVRAVTLPASMVNISDDASRVEKVRWAGKFAGARAQKVR